MLGPVIACGQAEILGKHCVSCEGPLPRTGAVLCKIGWMCSEDCAADWEEQRAQQRAVDHLHTRDLMCDCDTCVAASHPTEAERAEWAKYLATDKGVMTGDMDGS